MKYPLTAIATLSLLAGCGEDGGLIGGGSPLDGDSRYVAMQQILAAVAEAPTPITANPTNPTASMNGTLTVAAPAANVTQVAVGTMTMNANFDTQQVSGNAGNFVLFDTNASTGQTTSSATSGAISYNGTIDIAQGASAVDGTVTGSVDIGTASGTISNGTISGGFYDTDIGLVSAGGIYGDIPANGGTTGLIGNYAVAD